MKKLLMVALSLSLGLPAFADTAFDSLTGERDRILAKSASGQFLTSEELARFQVIVSQIRVNQATRVQANAARQQNLIQNLDRLDQQNNLLEQTLFGGASTSNLTSLVPPAPEIELQPLQSYGPPLGDTMDNLLKLACAKSPELAEAVAAETKYSGGKEKTLGFILGIINSLAPYRGFADSSEAGDVILDEKLKLQSIKSSQYAQQRVIDQIHYKLTTNVLALAQGLGESDIARAEASYKTISDMTSSEAAVELKRQLDSHLRDNLPEVPRLDIPGREQEYQHLLKGALEKDHVIAMIKERVHRYNQKSKGETMAAHIIPAILGVARFAPYGIGIGAGVALGGFYSMTGGSELDKVLDELYLSQSLKSRSELYMNEIRMEMSAQESGSKVLVWASQSLLNQ